MMKKLFVRNLNVTRLFALAIKDIKTQKTKACCSLHIYQQKFDSIFLILSHKANN